MYKSHECLIIVHSTLDRYKIIKSDKTSLCPLYKLMSIGQNVWWMIFFTDLLLSSIPHITRFWLVSAIISCKASPCGKKQKRNNRKVKNKKNVSHLFIWIFLFEFYLKACLNFLRCFDSLTFENSLFSNKLSRCICRCKMIVNAAEKNQIKYLVQN